jgi:hypothetical protein
MKKRKLTFFYEKAGKGFDFFSINKFIMHIILLFLKAIRSRDKVCAYTQINFKNKKKISAAIYSYILSKIL